MDLLQLSVLMTAHVWLATATKIFYVLPDNSSDINCPSQPCATLSQYLLDNNDTLPVVSNIEYRFLPGEHHLPTGIYLHNLTNLTLAGTARNGSPLTVLVGSYKSEYLMTMFNLHEVKISHMVFKQSKVSHKVPYLFLVHSTYLHLENIVFLESGLMAYNIF